MHLRKKPRDRSASGTCTLDSSSEPLEDSSFTGLVRSTDEGGVAHIENLLHRQCSRLRECFRKALHLIDVFTGICMIAVSVWTGETGRTRLKVAP